ncbi:hypothetical protein GCM10008983_14370 [Lentibacillus halophilus]|uniref:VanZ like family protein n=1 Tax=Lentibacillus halophilus TaxID=295065 RepID=A0ABN0Z994_9BACI
MEHIILWLSFVIGMVLLWFSLRKLSFNEWILVYLVSSYFSIFLGTIVVEENMLHYPEKLLGIHFESSILFEYVILPVINLYFYQTTYRSRYSGILIQGVLYASVLTTMEVLLEKYTDVIEYHTWTWMHTFASVLLFMMVIRIAMRLYWRWNA